MSIVGRCNTCYNALGACTCKVLKPLEQFQAGKKLDKEQKKTLNN